jgi:phosphatidylinositol N-acetylglucosaminyltransferase subunit Y
MSDQLDSKFQSCNGRVISGFVFIASGVISFLFFFFASVLSKLLPPFQNEILLAIQNDWYATDIIFIFFFFLLMIIY